jgi:HK97 family phage prohead protease
MQLWHSAAVSRDFHLIDSPTGSFEGYASIFEAPDSQGDVVDPTAFDGSLKSWQAKRRMPAMLWQHDAGEPIGVWLDIRIDAVGLKVRGRLLLTVKGGAEAYEHLKAGSIDGLSIGYQTVEAVRDRRTGLRRLTKIQLWEVSLVTFPANDDARVGAVKSDRSGSTASKPDIDRLIAATARAVASVPKRTF